MKIRDLMSTSVRTISPEATILDAARSMREHHVGNLVVVDRRPEGTVPIGIITDRDITVGPVAQDIPLKSVFVRDVMGRDLIVARSDEEMEIVLKRMRQHAVRRIPIVNTFELLVGILTYDDIISQVAEDLADLTRLTPKQIAKEHLQRT